MNRPDAIPARLASCPCCGLVQTVPAPVPPGRQVRCGRCRSRLRPRVSHARRNEHTAAVALAALLLYPPAIGLPMLRIEQFGHGHEAGILEGVATLLAGGHLVVGIVVLLCSVVLPLGKLLSLLILSAGGLGLRREHRALTYKVVEWTGRWGMLDVLLVALLVATLKLGDMVTVTAGPAAFAFTAVVVLSLLASACFDPHALWESS
ncbi:MAG: paraquat-inducible protein A [Planctomycetota bacterium]|jgi:paraquat-inducible protein A